MDYKQFELKHRPGPWRIASQDYENAIYYIHAKDHTDYDDERELQIVKVDYRSSPIVEHLDAAKEVATLISIAPSLLSRCQELERENKRLREALESIADSHLMSSAPKWIARAALKNDKV